MKYIPADKLIAEIENTIKAAKKEMKDRDVDSYSDSPYDEKIYARINSTIETCEDIIDTITSLQQEAEKERIKEQKELNKIAIQYRDDVIAHIKEKRALPSFKGQLLHDFKNEVNTMKQILGVLNWGDIQYALFEKFALVFAAWGGYHFHPKEIESEDSLQQEQPEAELFECPKTPIKDAVEVTSRMKYIDEELKPIAEFIMDYASWNLHKDEWNQPVIEVPLFRVLDALIQKGKSYCCTG